MNSSPLANKIAGLLSRKSSQAGAATRPARLGFAASCAAIAAALAAALGASAPADASVFNYGSAGSAHTVNAGILQLDSAKQIVAGQLPNSTSGTNDALSKTSGALYSFYVLDQRADYKPAGWRFTNPLAPTTVTSDIQNLFSANYTLGQQVTPDMAAYWMVNLPSVTAGYVPGTTNPLSQFDILVIRVTPNNSQRVIGLSRAEREVLRDYVDQGGTLWIEDAGNASTRITDDDTGGETPAGLFVDVTFHDDTELSGAPYVSDADHRHPTLTEPNFLSYPELDGLSYGYNGTLPYWISSQAGTNDKPDFDFLSIVVGTTGRQLTSTAQPVIAAGDFGSGHVVIDDCNILGGISDAVGGGSSTDTGFAPANLAAAQSSDLQYAYNVISWSGAESTTDGGDVRHTGAQTTADIGSSLLPSWVYPDPNYNNTLQSTNQAAVTGLGVAVSGNIAYVTSLDSTGGGTAVPTLHAFDIDPAEDLNQDDNPDDGDVIAGNATLPTDPTTGVPYVQDFSAGLNYDELWSAQVGTDTTNISAPTIAAIPSSVYSGINSSGYYGTVMVEDRSGNVYLFDATSNPAIATPTSLKKISSGSSGKFPNHKDGIVPSPVYSHGWLIAPQPVSSGEATEMLVYLGGGATDPPRYIEQLANTDATANADATPVISTPAVAMVPSLDTKYGGSDIVAYVATQQAVYPQFLGSRDEEVMSGSYPSTFETKLSSIEGATDATTAPIHGVTSLVGAPEDAFATADGRFFSYLSADPSWVTGTTGLEHEPNFRASMFGTSTNPSLDLTITENGSDGSATTAYTDYDVVPGGKIGGTTSGTATLSRHQILAAVGGNPIDTTLVQGIAVGDDDTLYMTVNEANGAYIEAVQEQNPMLNSTSSNGTLIKWRYSIGNNSSYAPNGLNSNGNAIPKFVGAPVVDRNHVYALATDSTGDNAYVLCFNHNANFTLVTGTISEGSVTLQQTDESGTVRTLDPSQYNITDSQTGTIAITDFSPQPTSDYVIWPNLSVTIPITTNLGDNNPANTSTSINSDSSGSGLLAWCSVAIPRGKLATNNTRAVPGALHEFGSYLYFSNGVITVDSNKVSQLSSVASDSGGANPNPNVIDSIELNSSTFLDGSLAASGTSVIGAGTGGIVGMAYTGTVVADSNRLIEYAPDGSPMWSLDSTIQQAPVLDTTNPTTPATTVATTNVSLARPSSVTMLASNDILFADTGNNRCVRVDRGGGVLWELNSFNDPTGLLAPGQPLTLNDPTSVVEWRETYTDNNVTPSNRVTIEHYLVADAGNYRVLEIDDIYTNGNIYTTDTREYHVLRWVSHTFDKAGRNYRFTYASRYYNGANSSTTPPEILAGVANRQIAPLIKQSASATPYLDSAARDTAGSSIVLLNYALPAVAIGTFTPPATSGTQNPGPATVYRAPTYSATANVAVTGTFTDPINGLPSGLFTQIIYEPTTGSTPVTIPIRNLRYVNAYFPAGQANPKNSPGENIVLCDDDGVFDGIAYGSNTTATYSVVAVKGYDTGNGTLPNAVGFSFTLADYNQLSSIGVYAPMNVFTPTSAQRLDSGNYLITNGAASGDATAVVDSKTIAAADLANNLLHFGGDVVEVNGVTKEQVGTIGSESAAPTTFGRTKTSPVQGSGSNASTTSPLSLPAYAVRSR